MAAIDENLQSRQLAVYGHQAMGKLSQAKVLVSGLNGLGCEIAKNVILANVAKVVLHDTKNVTAADLGALFYAAEEEVGHNRATACVRRLKELNPGVQVDAISGALSEGVVGGFDVVVAVDMPGSEAARIDAFCHANHIAFIRTDVHGVFGSLFTDYGKGFVVHDTTGEEIKTAIVASITNGSPCVVHCTEDDRLDYEEGDTVVFSELVGIPELADGRPRKVKNVRATSFEIEGEDSTNYGKHISGGLVTQVKQPKTLEFRPLYEAIKDPGNHLESDFSKFGRSALLHLGFHALDQFREKHNGALPRPGSRADADEVVAMVRDLNPQMPEAHRVELDAAAEKVIRQLASGAQSTINPLAAIFGGIAGQEVIKAITGKFHPVFQWFYFDSVEALPAEELPEAALQPVGSRYDAQIMLWGQGFQETLGNLNYFMVGAGALGCEFIKNFAMMGVACGPRGRLTITDDDTIEKSNLSRQFLFRNYMIGQPKSVAAAGAARPMNPKFNIVPMQDRVSEKTEDIFNDEFWNGLDGVCNALDNIKARLYVDARCVFFGKSLLESGTLGPKCSTQVIVPHLTENFGAARDPPEKQAPDCTLHHFPHNINHCLSWGRSEFIGHFESAPSDAVAFLQKREAYVASQEEANANPNEILEKLKAIAEIFRNPCKTYADCVKWARLQFEENFVNKIKQLVFTFPRDAKTSSGAPFWSPPKRFPQALAFDPRDPVHAQFVMAAANLRAAVFGIPITAEHRDPFAVANEASQVPVEPFVPKSGVKINVNPNESGAGDASGAGEDEGSVRGQINAIVAELLASPALATVRLHPLEFEKDDDTNFHMDFIGGAGNLRGRNYEIKEVDKLQAKLIAGRIIPAIATATALATGLVCLELLKLVQKKAVDAYRNSFVNLALPIFAISEPVPPAKVKSRVEKNIPDPINHPEYVEEENIVAYPEGHTVWDKIVLNFSPSNTLSDIVSFCKQHHGLELQSVTLATSKSAGVIIYNSLMASTKPRLAMTISDILETVAKEPLGNKKYIRPALMFANEDGDHVEVPEIVLNLA